LGESSSLTGSLRPVIDMVDIFSSCKLPSLNEDLI